MTRSGSWGKKQRSQKETVERGGCENDNKGLTIQFANPGHPNSLKTVTSWEFPNLAVLNLAVCNFYAEALFCALLRSFAPFCALFQKNPRVRKIRVRNSGAGNGCANFMDTSKKCVLSAGKTMSVKFPFFGGGFLGGGGEVPILFLWARGFFWLLRTCVCALLRSFAWFLRPTAFRTTAFGNCRTSLNYRSTGNYHILNSENKFYCNRNVKIAKWIRFQIF